MSGYCEHEAKVAKKMHAVKRSRGETKDADSQYKRLAQQNDVREVQHTAAAYKSVLERAVGLEEISFAEAREVMHGVGTLQNRLNCLKRHLRQLKIDVPTAKRVLRMEAEIRSMETILKALSVVARKIRFKAEVNGPAPEKYWSDDKLEPIE